MIMPLLGRMVRRHEEGNVNRCMMSLGFVEKNGNSSQSAVLCSLILLLFDLASLMQLPPNKMCVAFGVE